MAQKTMIGVIGSSARNQREMTIAEEVGARIADRGALLVCGGMGGVMEAACRGAKKNGGTTLGILPGVDRDSGNDYLDVVVPTGMGYARNILVVLSSHGIVAVGGAFGTLSEIAYGNVFQIPLVGIETWELKENRFPGCIEIVQTAEEAIETIFQKIEKK